MNCKICGGPFATSADKIVLCAHHKNFVHKGCCVNQCSGDGEPCMHCKGIYTKK